MSLISFRKNIPLHAVVLPVFKSDKVVEIQLGKENGKAVFDNGMEVSFNTKQMCLLDQHMFAAKLYVKSMGGSHQWMSMGKIWNSLKNVERLTLNGAFYHDELESLLKLCKSLKALTCAYWTAQSFGTVLENVTLDSLLELTVYVSGTKDISTKIFESLEARAETTPNMIEKLFLVFEEKLIGDVTPTIYTMISKCLANGSNVHLLYKSEAPCFCMETLVNDKYEIDGFVQLAENNTDYAEAASPKQYVRYKLFKKKYGKCLFFIGCGKCECNVDTEFLPRVSNIGNQTWKSKNIGAFGLYEPSKIKYDSHRHIALGGENGKPFALQQRLSYVKENDRKCCNVEEVGEMNYYLTTDTSIDHICFFKHNIGFRLSNGLYFQAMSLESALNFLNSESCVASKCLTIHSIFKYGCHTEIENIHNFLRHARHLEFTGYWTAAALELLVSQTSANLNTIVMMRIDVAGLNFKNFVASIPPKTKKNLHKICLDARSTSLMSLASVVNALDVHEKSIDYVNQLFLAVRQIEDVQNPMTLEKCVEKLDGIVVNSAKVFLMVDEGIADNTLDYMQCRNPSDALVPVKYDNDPSSRKESRFMTICDCHYDAADFKILCPAFWV